MSAPRDAGVELLERLVRLPEQERADFLGDGPQSSVTLAAMIEHASRMTLGGSLQADAATNMLVNLADQRGSHLDRARARRARARALSYAGQFQDALAACDEGYGLAQQAGDAIEAGRTRLASMHALGELGRLEDAIAAGDAARRAFLEAGESGLAARADLNVGTAHQRRDDPAAAIVFFDRARPALAGEPSMLGPLDNNRGEALLALNDFSGAERAFTSAITNFNAAGNAIGAAIAESNLADLATRQGRLQQAMRHFEQARRALESGGSPAHLARVFAEQAEVMSMLGMTEEAVDEYERALTALDRQGLALESARARAGLGAALLRLNRLAGAETALAAAARGFDELKHETARARVDLRRAELAASNGRLADARATAMRALATLHDRPADAAAARLVLARLAQAAGTPHEAMAELNHGLALANRMRVAPLAAEILQQRASLHRDAGQLDQAIDDLRGAADEIEKVRDALLAERFRTAFLGHRTPVYEELVTALLDRNGDGDVSEAFETAERAKSRSLVESMQRDLSGDSKAIDAKGQGSDDEVALITRQIQEARGELNALYSVLSDDRVRTSHGEQEWRQRMVQVERRVDELEARLATTADADGVVRASVAAFQATADSVLALLERDTALIEYFTAGDEVIAFVASGGAIKVVRRVGSIARAVNLMQSLRFQVNRALRPGALEGERGHRLVDDAHIVLEELSKEVVERLADEIAGATRLMIVPHGVLHALPFHALQVGGRLLLETHAISYAPSVTLLAAISRRTSAHDLLSRPLVVGVADEFAPEIEEEARMVGNVLAAPAESVLLGDRAQAQHVMSHASRSSLVHLACHGRYAPEAPLGSGMRLADRWVTARELLQARIQAQLVTLSGCETGLNLVKAGDELLGLQRGFFVSGTARVLASLWRVDDSTTREFMLQFYGSLGTLEPGPWQVAYALRSAQIHMRESHPHPALWASFVLSGRP